MSSLSFCTSLQDIQGKISKASSRSLLAKSTPQLIAVSKGQAIDKINEALEAGHLHFGENKVQEATEKFAPLKKDHPHLCLHLIGPLQSNKTVEAVALFDVIHTIDREKIALSVGDAMHRQQKICRLLVQINTGEEKQKAGILPSALADFLQFCKIQANIEITGLMCIPPVNDNPALHFGLLYHLAKQHGLQDLSMGMSNDYETATHFAATYVRVGTALFGHRN